MAEISREEAIKIADFNLDVFDSDADISKMMRKAISDMEKLEKIEQIFDDCDRTIAGAVFNGRLVCMAIEQILKGEEDD